MEEGIEVIANDIQTNGTIRYIKASDDKYYGIVDTDTKNTTGVTGDSMGGLDAFHPTCAKASDRETKEYAETWTNDSVYYINSESRGRTIFHSDAFAAGDVLSDGTFPFEVNCDRSDPCIKTKGNIRTEANIYAENGMVKCNSAVVTNGVSCGTLTVHANDGTGTVNINGSGVITCEDNSGAELVMINNNPGEIYCGNILMPRVSEIRVGSDIVISANNNISSITAPAFYQDSDERLKTFTEDYDINLDNLKNIKTGKFYWNADDTQTINGGVSAQTVEEYFPELVRENEEGIKTVNYDGLAVVAIAAIKKLTDRIEQLEEIVRNK